MERDEFAISLPNEVQVRVLQWDLHNTTKRCSPALRVVQVASLNFTIHISNENHVLLKSVKECMIFDAGDQTMLCQNWIALTIPAYPHIQHKKIHTGLYIIFAVTPSLFLLNNRN
jgi:hypothetical protein